ncbi:carbohydrate ABC transporter permease [Brachybacterium sp. MASK1Z-5]|uniref:Carbohydrate ABC transporter permease n=1 Tax=Brachybacterium halotolerans TaxID=2795215 RepID=A0ABS1BED0_9MICO|nr:carbohydrate ABC transporter permease [Brachybacterium halotolerans]MBK0333023.1 carbohydrate ABC transporter permease [Brachybacterium halotolerans]
MTAASRRRTLPRPRRSGQTPWAALRPALLTIAAIVCLIPIFVVVGLAFRPLTTSSTRGMSLESFAYVLSDTNLLVWLRNSLVATLAATLISVMVAAPAGYVISRGRSRAVSAFSLGIFVVQALPVVIFVIPLFILFSRVQLVDSLVGVTIIYVASSLTVATWMMAAYFDSIPSSLEEAAWIDGCSIFGGFVRIVLRNSLPGVLSTAIYAFLLAWNDYLIALVFLRTDSHFTLPIGLQTFFQQNATDWGPVMASAVVMMTPPIIIFALLNRYFSVGGIGGSLAGQ